MAYDEQSFVDGLACGLTATDARPVDVTRQALLTGTRRMTGTLPDGAFDTFVSRVSIRTPSPVTILYEYGAADAETLAREFRRVGASDEAQTVYHVARIPQAASLRDFRYNAYLVRQDDAEIHFDARFMSFPYYASGASYLYPGTPEQVDVWWVRTSQ